MSKYMILKANKTNIVLFDIDTCEVIKGNRKAILRYYINILNQDLCKEYLNNGKNASATVVAQTKYKETGETLYFTVFNEHPLKAYGSYRPQLLKYGWYGLFLTAEQLSKVDNLINVTVAENKIVGNKSRRKIPSVKTKPIYNFGVLDFTYCLPGQKIILDKVINETSLKISIIHNALYGCDEITIRGNYDCIDLEDLEEINRVNFTGYVKTLSNAEIPYIGIHKIDNIISCWNSCLLKDVTIKKSAKNLISSFQSMKNQPMEVVEKITNNVEEIIDCFNYLGYCGDLTLGKKLKLFESNDICGFDRIIVKGTETVLKFESDICNPYYFDKDDKPVEIVLPDGYKGRFASKGCYLSKPVKENTKFDQFMRTQTKRILFGLKEMPVLKYGQLIYDNIQLKEAIKFCTTLSDSEWNKAINEAFSYGDDNIFVEFEGLKIACYFKHYGMPTIIKLKENCYAGYVLRNNVHIYKTSKQDVLRESSKDHSDIGNISCLFIPYESVGMQHDFSFSATIKFCNHSEFKSEIFIEDNNEITKVVFDKSNIDDGILKIYYQDAYCLKEPYNVMEFNINEM